MQTGERGFTLVELMITVLIIAILASIAIPSYRSYVMRSQRTDARTALLRVQANEEKFFLQNNAYTADLAALGLLAASDNGLYTVTVALVGAGYTATADAIAGKGQDQDAKCDTFTIDQSGTHGATGSATNPIQYCWH